jgi:hypothetical protein
MDHIKIYDELFLTSTVNTARELLTTADRRTNKTGNESDKPDTKYFENNNGLFLKGGVSRKPTPQGKLVSNARETAVLIISKITSMKTYPNPWCVECQECYTILYEVLITSTKTATTNQVNKITSCQTYDGKEASNKTVYAKQASKMASCQTYEDMVIWTLLTLFDEYYG